jgi:hypothetical protein
VPKADDRATHALQLLHDLDSVGLHDMDDRYYYDGFYEVRLGCANLLAALGYDAR